MFGVYMWNGVVDILNVKLVSRKIRLNSRLIDMLLVVVLVMLVNRVVFVKL